MPILQNAKKALRSSKRKAEVNGRIKSRMKTMMDKVKAEPTAENLRIAYAAIDVAAKRIIHPNRAARLKSQLSRLTSSK